MNYHKLKQEIVPIVGLSIFQIWWNFNFPAVIRLGSSFAIVLSVVSILIYGMVFTNAHQYRPYFDLESFNDAPESDLLKSLLRYGLVIFGHSIALYMWYVDFYHMQDIYYLIWYGHMAISMSLLYKAIYR